VRLADLRRASRESFTSLDGAVAALDPLHRRTAAAALQAGNAAYEHQLRAARSEQFCLCFCFLFFAFLSVCFIPIINAVD
jgi:hypothetical protein